MVYCIPFPLEGLNNKGHTLEFIWLILKGKKEEELSQITPCDPREFLLALRGPSDLLKEETSEAKWAKEAMRAKVIGVEASFWASPHKHGRWLRQCGWPQSRPRPRQGLLDGGGGLTHASITASQPHHNTCESS